MTESRVRFRRPAGSALCYGEYVIEVQDKPRGRWRRAGIVRPFGPDWAAMPFDGGRWTGMHKTRRDAAAELLRRDT
jgi:hypothetical protein